MAKQSESNNPMEPVVPLIFMKDSTLVDDRYSTAFLNLEPLSIPDRATHLPPIYLYKGDIHPHRKHRPQAYIGNTYIYILDTSVEGLENARDCGSVDKVPHMPKTDLLSLGKIHSQC